MKLVQHIKEDKMMNRNAPPFVQQFKAQSNHIMGIDGELVMYGDRVVIPKAKCKEVLQALNVTHQGINRTRDRAKM